jgi:hypothetical protein
MASILEQVEIVLFVTAIVGILARRLHIPATAGLVVAGFALALMPGTIKLTLTKELIFDAFLPPLVFEAALYVNWNELRKDALVILTLATAGVLLTAGATAAGMHYFLHWSWQAAALFGILIAATDPVSVIATFKEAGVSGRLRLLVEAESLFNDGIAAVAQYPSNGYGLYDMAGNVAEWCIDHYVKDAYEHLGGQIVGHRLEVAPSRAELGPMEDRLAANQLSEHVGESRVRFELGLHRAHRRKIPRARAWPPPR